MKNLFFLLLIPMFCLSQQKLNERQVIDKSHIDFTSQYVYFVIDGEIEIDGHTAYNGARKSPIIFQANLDGVTIIDTSTGVTYSHRHCNEEKQGCKIIHLVAVSNMAVPHQGWWNGMNLLDSLKAK